MHKIINFCIVISVFTLCSKKETPEEINVVNISNTPGRSENPAIAADSRGYFYVVWDDKFVSEESLVIYMVSRPPGGEWSKPVKIFEPRAARAADIEIDNSNTIHLAWQNTNPQGWMEILYSQKPLNGNWTKPETISIYGISAIPNIAVDNNGDVHLIWQEIVGGLPIFYIKKSYDGVWSMLVEISKENAFMRSEHRIAVDHQGNAHVVWMEIKTDSGPDYIVYTTNALGDTWAYPKVISILDYKAGIGWPSIAIDNDGIIHVVWHQARDIFYAFKSPTSEWSSPTQICSTTAISLFPHLAIQNNTLHLVWNELENMLCYTTKKGSAWEGIQQWASSVSSAGAGVFDIAAGVSSIGIVLWGYKPPDYDNSEIYFWEILKD